MKNAISPNTRVDRVKLKPPNMKKPIYYRDNYNSLTSAKFPPKNDDGQLKLICVDKKADRINTLIDKIISVIRTMAALEVMITVIPRVVW